MGFSACLTGSLHSHTIQAVRRIGSRAAKL